MKYRGVDIVSDIAATPEPAESFDAILCPSVFEHIVNLETVVREFSRLCRGGTLDSYGAFLQLYAFCSISLCYGVKPVLV